MGLRYEHLPVSFPPAPAYRALNPLGTVPFLEDGDVAITESVAIMLYLAERYGPTPLLPDEPVARARVLEWALFGEASFAAALTPLLTARFGAPAAESRNWSVRVLEGRIASLLRYVAARLPDGGFLVGDDLTLADISVVTAMMIWQGGLKGEVPDALVAYRARVTGRPAFERARVACR